VEIGKFGTVQGVIFEYGRRNSIPIIVDKDLADIINKA